MRPLRHAWFIAMKDLKIFFQDRTALFFFIAFPFMFIILFNFLLRGVGSEDTRLELHLVTLEPPGGLSEQIIGAMETRDPDALAPGDPLIVWDKDYAADRQAVEDGDLAGFIAFPADFTAAVTSGQPTSLQVVADAGDVNTRAALNGVAQAISSRVGADEVIIRVSVQLGVESGVLSADILNNQAAMQGAIQHLIEGLMGGTEMTSYLTFTTDKVGEVEEENPANYVIPGYLVMFVFFAAAVASESIVRERTNHTLERLLASSVKRSAILGGIFTGTFIRGLVQIVIFWTVGILVFKVDLGLSPAGVLILSVLMVIMSAAFSLMLATLARTQRSAGSLAVITSLVLAPLGGCWWPFFLYPAWLQNIARITPHAWAVIGFDKLMVFGADFSAAVPSILALAGFAVAFGLIAIWRFRTGAV
jgi:ABC-2 type transport system permease protein